jgi:hypothetical protein
MPGKLGIDIDGLDGLDWLKPLPNTRAPGYRLREAALKGDLATLKELLKAGVDVNDADEDGVTALMAAAYGGRIKAAKELLLQPSSKADLVDKWGRTAFTYGVARSNFALVERIGKLRHVDKATNTQVYTFDILISDNFGLEPWRTDLENIYRADSATFVAISNIFKWRTSSWQFNKERNPFNWKTDVPEAASTKRTTRRARSKQEDGEVAPVTGSGNEDDSADWFEKDDDEPLSSVAGPSSFGAPPTPPASPGGDSTSAAEEEVIIRERIRTPPNEGSEHSLSIDEQIEKLQKEGSAAKAKLQAARLERKEKVDKLEAAKTKLVDYQKQILDLQKGFASKPNMCAETIVALDEKIRSLEREGDDETVKYSAAREERKRKREELQARKTKIEELEREMEDELNALLF